MSRRLFTVASSLSLVLCVGVVVMWVRSYDVSDRFSHQTGSAEMGLVSARGEVGVFRREPFRGGTRSGWSHAAGPPQPLPIIPGVSLRRSGVRRFDFTVAGPLLPPGRERGTVASHWIIVAATALLPAAWVMHWRKNRASRARAERGLCVRCGYDLRATADRCPECGTVVAKQTT